MSGSAGRRVTSGCDGVSGFPLFSFFLRKRGFERAVKQNENNICLRGATPGGVVTLLRPRFNLRTDGAELDDELSDDSYERWYGSGTTNSSLFTESGAIQLALIEGYGGSTIISAIVTHFADRGCPYKTFSGKKSASGDVSGVMIDASSYWIGSVSPKTKRFALVHDYRNSVYVYATDMHVLTPMEARELEELYPWLLSCKVDKTKWDVAWHTPLRAETLMATVVRYPAMQFKIGYKDDSFLCFCHTRISKQNCSELPPSIVCMLADSHGFINNRQRLFVDSANPMCQFSHDVGHVSLVPDMYTLESHYLTMKPKTMPVSEFMHSYPPEVIMKGDARYVHFSSFYVAAKMMRENRNAENKYSSRPWAWMRNGVTVESTLNEDDALLAPLTYEGSIALAKLMIASSTAWSSYTGIQVFVRREDDIVPVTDLCATVISKEEFEKMKVTIVLKASGQTYKPGDTRTKEERYFKARTVVYHSPTLAIEQRSTVAHLIGVPPPRRGGAHKAK